MDSQQIGLQSTFSKIHKTIIVLGILIVIVNHALPLQKMNMISQEERRIIPSRFLQNDMLMVTLKLVFLENLQENLIIMFCIPEKGKGVPFFITITKLFSSTNLQITTKESQKA